MCSTASATAPTYAQVPPPNSVDVADGYNNTLQSPYRASAWDQANMPSAPSSPNPHQYAGVASSSTNTVPNYYPGGVMTMVPVHASQPALVGYSADSDVATQHDAYKSAASAPPSSTRIAPSMLTVATAVPYAGGNGDYPLVAAHVVTNSADV